MWPRVVRDLAQLYGGEIRLGQAPLCCAATLQRHLREPPQRRSYQKLVPLEAGDRGLGDDGLTKRCDELALA